MKYFDRFLQKFVCFFFDWRVASSVIFAGSAGFCIAERNLSTMPMALLICLSIMSFITLVSGRIFTGIYFGFSILTVITFVTYMKIQWMSLAPTVVDIYYFVMNPGTLKFLIAYFPLYVAVSVLLFFGSLLLLLTFCRYERKSSRRRLQAAVVFPIAVLMVFAATPREFSGIGELMRFRYVTAFFSSMRYLAYLDEPVPLLERLPATLKSGTGPQIAGLECRKKKDKPNIFVVQAESIVAPQLFVDGPFPKPLAGGYSGEDGVVRELGVETFAGGTWVTTGGGLTSLPISDLGWLKGYSNFVLADKVDWSMSQMLAECGYRTVYLSPLSYSFVNEGSFIESLHFDTFLDQYALGARTNHEPDTFYYERAMEIVEREQQEDDRPIFMVILTMSAHGPWDFRLQPDMQLTGEPYFEEPVLNEYARRLQISRMALDDFGAKLARNVSRPTVLVEFGDHQPGLLSAHWQDLEGADALKNPDSGAYSTFYQVRPVGMKLTGELPNIEKLDVQYLGPTIIEMAGLPLDPVQRNLNVMRDACGGRFYDCQEPEMLEAHFQCRRDFYAGGNCGWREPNSGDVAALRPTLQ